MPTPTQPRPAHTGPKRFSSPPSLSLLFSPLFILSTLLLTLVILYNFAAPELSRLTGLDLEKIRDVKLQDLDLGNVDWGAVGRGVWGWVDPRLAFQRGQGLGVWIRREGPGWVRAVRERMEL